MVSIAQIATAVLTGLLGASCDPDDVRHCRACGCTDDDCHVCIERTGAPCWWVTPELCSACVDAPEVGQA